MTRVTSEVNPTEVAALEGRWFDDFKFSKIQDKRYTDFNLGLKHTARSKIFVT